MKIVKSMFIILLLAVGCDIKRGFVETELKLSAESRLPKFISYTNNIKPTETIVTITIYSNILGGKARVIAVSKANKNNVLYDKTGNFKWHQLSESQLNKSKSYDAYPKYFIIKIKDIDDTFMQKAKGDIICAIDDPK